MISITRSLTKSRQAYELKDIEMLKASHRMKSEGGLAANYKHKEGHSNVGNFLKSAVYGGMDGLITTFAVVMGSFGADLSTGVIVILGLANMLGDGVSMSLGDLISTKTENEYNLREKKREEWEWEQNPDGEAHEMVETYMNHGIDEDDANLMANILSKNKKAMVDIMMLEELGIIISTESPFKSAIITFLSFITFGIIPIIPYIISLIAGGSEISLLPISLSMTVISLFLLGFVKSYFTGQYFLKAGLETLLVGVISAGFAFLVGFILEPLAKA